MAEVSGSNNILTQVASGNMDGSQFCFANFTGADVWLTATSGSNALGVLQNKPRNNEHAAIVTHGNTKIRMANSIGAGSRLMSGNSGFAVIATSGQYVCGTALTGATSGGIGEMFFNGYDADVTLA